MKKLFLIVCVFTFAYACKNDDDSVGTNNGSGNSSTYPGVEAYLDIDISSLPNYSNINYPVHYDAGVLANDNTPANNAITDEGATLGRVLFYDTQLSINATKSCASCHIQSLGFVDSDQFSVGFNGGLTGAHSMRTVNARFYEGNSMFWDKRAASVEEQSTMPIQDAVEMGFDVSNGGIDSLINRMYTLPYYPELFELVFGDTTITEARMQLAMAQFVRSMVSIDSKFDDGYATAYNAGAPGNGIGTDFTNFTAQENTGKQLFLAPPPNGAGCAGCHNPPTFSLDPNSRSNGLDAGETVIFKSPSLKSVAVTGPYMHGGTHATLDDVVEHYNSEIQIGPALDARLMQAGQPQQLNLTQGQKNALAAFLHTLTDSDLASDPKFTDPFL